MELFEECHTPKNSPRTTDDGANSDVNSYIGTPCPRRKFKGKPKLSKPVRSKGIPTEKKKDANKEKEIINVFGGSLKLQPSKTQHEKIKAEKGKEARCKLHVLPAIDKVLSEYSDIPQEWFEKKVWDILCNHSPQLGHHTKEEYFRRLIKWRKGCASDLSDGSCVLCDIQKATSKSLRSNLDLDRLNYTYEYYNKFSRKGTADKFVGDEQESDTQPQECTVCVPDASAVPNQSPSPCQRIYSNIVSPCRLLPSPTTDIFRAKVMDIPRTLSQPRSSPVPNIELTGETPDSEHTDSRAEKLRQMYMPEHKRIHHKCKPRHFLVQTAPEKAASKLHIAYRRKAFKGLPLKVRTGTVGLDKLPECESEQTYEVENLGLRFNLPDYNPNLGNRHVSIPKSYSYRPVVIMQKGGKSSKDDASDKITTDDGNGNKIPPLIFSTHGQGAHPNVTYQNSSSFIRFPSVRSVVTPSEGAPSRLSGNLSALPQTAQSDNLSILPPINKYPSSILMQLAN